MRPAVRLTSALLCLTLTGLWSLPATAAATAAGTSITQTATAATASNVIGTATSNIPSAVTVTPVYGFGANPFAAATSTVPISMTQGQPATYGFSIKNNGNAPDKVYVIISPINQSGSYAGVTWGVEVDDASPFVSGLTWKNSGTTAANGGGDRATSEVSVNPGGTAQFTMRVTGANAPYGATMSFSITLETVGDTTANPAGAYTGFNGQSYAGAGSVSNSGSGGLVPAIPPVVHIALPVSGFETIQTNTTVTGVTEPGVTGTVKVAGPGTGQMSVSSLSVDGSGNFNKTVGLYAGLNQILTTVRDWNGNTSSDAVNVTSDPGAPVVSFDMVSEQAGPQVPILGRAYDTLGNLESYTVSYGTGAAPTAWKTISTGTSAVGSSSAAGTLATWNATGLSGTYTLKLTATERAPFSRTSEVTKTILLANNVALSGTLPVGQWTMMSLPGRPLNADPSAFLGSSRYEVQQWDPSLPEDPQTLRYKFNNITINTAGAGFWVKPYQQNIDYSVQAYVTDTAQNVALDLKTGWNQIGSPYLTRGANDTDFNWGLVKVRINSGTAQEETKSMVAAISAGWIDSQFYGYQNKGYTGYTTDNNLVPYTGYFVNTFRDCQLVFEPGAGLPMNMARIVRPAWTLQIAAATDDANDIDNYAVMMAGAKDNFDPADSSEPPTVKPYVTLYFENSNSQNVAEKLAKDTRAPAEKKQTKTWNFVVEVSDPNKTVTVSAPNAKDLPGNYEYLIRDEVTGQTFNPKVQTSYSFVSDGTARRFTLTTQRIGAEIFATISRNFPSGWSLFTAPVEAQPSDVREQLSGQLDNPQVFQYYDQEYYDPDNPMGVDIQAGIGYWLYLDKSASLNFEGYPTDPKEPVEIPLVAGWNLVGNPYEDKTINGEDMSVSRNGETVSLSEAVTRGWLFPEIFSYNPVTGGYERLETGAAMTPWQGYAINALEACTLIISPEQE
jgi:hypothetical protein